MFYNIAILISKNVLTNDGEVDVPRLSLRLTIAWFFEILICLCNPTHGSHNNSLQSLHLKVAYVEQIEQLGPPPLHTA